MDGCDDIENIFFALALALSLFFIYIAMKQVPAHLPPYGSVKKPAATTTDGPDSSDTILKKLIDNGATFYGASWCGFTKKQLAELKITETNTRGLDYVDCEREDELCASKGVDAYPTWQINGQKYPGYYPLNKLLELLTEKH
jgi:hypothetical protein